MENLHLIYFIQLGLVNALRAQMQPGGIPTPQQQQSQQQPNQSQWPNQFNQQSGQQPQQNQPQPPNQRSKSHFSFILIYLTDILKFSICWRNLQ